MWLTLLALALGALSLLFPSTPSYDPYSWLIWGREIFHGQLHIAGGSSWKPLPVIFTTVFALFGSAQPNLWLVVARAGCRGDGADVRQAHRADHLEPGLAEQRRRAAAG